MVRALFSSQASGSSFPFDTASKSVMPLPIISNQYQRKSASKSRENRLFVQGKINCCLVILYNWPVGVDELCRGAPRAPVHKFSSNVCTNFKLARSLPFALSKSIQVSLFSLLHFDASCS